MRHLICLLLFVGGLLGQEPPKTFPRGAKPSPRYKLQAATPHKILRAAPAQFAVVPKQLSMWFNDTYGCCVTSQEAFAKAAWSVQCGLPELFVPDAEVKRWASKYGVLNGADLVDVMQKMQRDGFTVDGKNYKDGPFYGVDYSNEAVLQNAIYTGPVNIAIDADALPSGAGNSSGWYAVGGGRFPQTDHCVALAGFGTAEFLYKQLGLQMPAALAGKSGYLLFTWNTIGFVDHAWLMSTCVEAWVRKPTTPGQEPGPPDPDPIPVPNGISITLSGDLKAGTYQIGNGITLDPKMTLEELIALVGKGKTKPAEKEPLIPPPEKPAPMPPEKPAARPAVGEEVRDADGKIVPPRMGRAWGPGVPMPAGLERYERDGWTQLLHRGPDGEPLASKVSVDRLPEKFRVSGGLDGIDGWRSTKYRFFPSAPVDGVAMVPLSGGVKLPGLVRTYPDGSELHDVLTNDKDEVFEHRQRKLKGREWQNAILYENAEARPEGYNQLGLKACAKCHKDAGTGEAGKPLVAGGSEVFSDPLAWNLLRR